MVAANTKKTPRESASVQPATKRATPKKTTTTTPVKPSKRKLPQKVRKGKPTFKLVDEDDEDQQETIPHKEGNDPDLELAMKLSLETPQEKGEGEGDDADLERAIKLSLDPALLSTSRRDQSPPDSTTGPSSQPEDDTSEKVVHESSSTSDSERTESDTESGTPKGDKVK
ncbi:retrovirus-related pol polyprotein from transposon TNT 1-94 [Tanacetum coccineum]